MLNDDYYSDYHQEGLPDIIIETCTIMKFLSIHE